MATKAKRLYFEAVKSFNMNELYYNSYDVQNMLLGQANFPEYYLKGDLVHDYYSDRVNDKWFDSVKETFPDEEYVPSVYNWSPEKLLEFANRVWKKVESEKVLAKYPEVTGARIVRYTNHSTQYPLYRLDVWIKDPANEMPPTRSDRIGSAREKRARHVIRAEYGIPEYHFDVFEDEFEDERK